MMTRRALFLFCALFSCAVVTSCDFSEKRVTAQASGFLNAFYTRDYSKAASFCEGKLESLMYYLENHVTAVPDDISDKISGACGETTLKINGVTVKRDDGTATVSYSTFTPAGEIKKGLILKKSGHIWKVSAML